MRNAIVAFLFLLFCSGSSLAQNPVREPSQPEPVPVARQSDLMGRSGMQAPKAIPSIKLLRFREIPVGTLLDNAVLDELQTASPLIAEQQECQTTAVPTGVAVNAVELPASEPTSGQH
jgi:hypothetical protein